jgi:hypothetical protein
MEQLVAFMKANDMPMDVLDSTARKLLVFDPEIPTAVSNKLSRMKNYEVRIAATCFDAGLAAREVIPNVIVIAVANGMTTCKAMEIAQSVRNHDLLRGAKILAAVTNLTPRKRDRLLSDGFDRCLGAPYTAFDLSELIEDAMDLVI